MYVFLGGLNAVVDFMTNLNDRGLLTAGEYMVIYIETQSLTEDVGIDKYLRSKILFVFYIFDYKACRTHSVAEYFIG